MQIVKGMLNDHGRGLNLHVLFKLLIIIVKHYKYKRFCEVVLAGWSYPGFKLGWGFWYKAHRCLQFIQVLVKVKFKLLLCHCDLLAVTSGGFNSYGPVIILLLPCCPKAWFSGIIHLHTSLAFREAGIMLGFTSKSTLEIRKRSQELTVKYKSSKKKSSSKTELKFYFWCLTSIYHWALWS